MILKNKISLLSLSLSVIIIFGMFSTMALASLNYQTTLKKGTETYTVNQYDEERWKNTVDLNTSPSDWFEGDTNITGAKSRITVKGWNLITLETYDVILNLLFLEFFTLDEIGPLLGIMETLGYNETTINANYTNSYNLWYGLRAVWNFTITDFEEPPSYTDGVKILQNPSDYITILNDYNDLAEELNGKFPIQMAGYNFPILDADKFLWILVFSGFAIAKPQSEYLMDLINELGCENATVIGSTLRINRYGESDYVVEVSYGEKGTLSSLLVIDDSENIIFQITSSNSEWIFYIILIIIAVCCVALVVYIIIRKRKLKV